MTNQNEKKDESKESIAEQFKKEFAIYVAEQRPNMDQLIGQLDTTMNQINAARQQHRDFTALGADRRAIANAWLLRYETIDSKYRDYLLALRIEEQATGIKQTIDKVLKETRTKLRQDYAKTLAALFDAKGHEAMYGAGTKSSGTN